MSQDLNLIVNVGSSPPTFNVKTKLVFKVEPRLVIVFPNLHFIIKDQELVLVGCKCLPYVVVFPSLPNSLFSSWGSYYKPLGIQGLVSYSTSNNHRDGCGCYPLI